MARSVQEVREYFTEQIEYRRKSPGDDLVSALVRAEEHDQKLTAAEVLSLIVLLQFGGAETPSHLIGTTLWELHTNPDAMATVQADRARYADAIEETLRAMDGEKVIFERGNKASVPRDSM